MPSSRAIRERYLTLKTTNQLLPYAITISELMQRCVVSNNKKNIDEDHRVVLLLEAADFKDFDALQIEKNFFTFLTNSRYIFRFFEELSTELVAIDDLVYADTYAEYEEHIEILHELYRRYKNLCDRDGVFEKIFLPQEYTLNTEYVKSLGTIHLHVEGYLTNFELSIVLQCSRVTPVILYFETNHFNKKLSLKFQDIGFELEANHRYEMNLNTKEIKKESISNRALQAVTQSFSQRLLQVAYVKQQIYSFIQQGIKPEKIVVVTPDENFADILRDFDDECYFNFAKGISLSQSKCYCALLAWYDYLDNDTVENRSRVTRFDLKNELSSHFKRNSSDVDFELLMRPFIEYEDDKEVIKIIEEELYLFSKVLLYLKENSLKSALHLFLKRIASRSIDDIRGGKITVMGLLETRMVEFEGVIIVDFNEGFVPRRSEKDLYLNSKVRERSKLPTLNDRESLQKLYYYNLMRRAKRVSISYVEDTQNIPSRFLKELGIVTPTKRDDTGFSTILFERHLSRTRTDISIEGRYDFKSEPLSASKLKTFLTCRRAFYYRYIQKIRPHEIEKDLPGEHEIGVILHEVLKEVYLAQSRYESADTLRRAITFYFEKKISDNVLHEYQLRLWLRRFELFIANEIERFEQGYEVLYCEKHFEKKYRNLTLHGVVDRVDRNGEDLEILDYKSGAFTLYTKNGVENAKDFQLEFYYLLVDGNNKSVAFYDLKECRIVEEDFLELKLEKLNTILDELGTIEYFSFEMTDDRSACRFCDYIHLCQRG